VLKFACLEKDAENMFARNDGVLVALYQRYVECLENMSKLIVAVAVVCWFHFVYEALLLLT
jgi:hypothetical protein